MSAAVTDHLTLARDTIVKINHTLELCLTRIDSLEKENVTLKQRVSELEVTRVNAPPISVSVPEPSATKLGSAPKVVVDDIAVEKEKIRQSQSSGLELEKNNNNRGTAMTPVNKTPVTAEDDESIETGIKVRSSEN